MPSYRQILYHIIFKTKNGEKTLNPEFLEDLFTNIQLIVQHNQCRLYRINGMEDHIHMLTDLHPSIALANFVRDIKSNSSFHLKNHKQFLNFKGWADGYAALTYTWRDKDLIINYIKNQQKHHQQETFHDEYQKLLKTHGLHLENEYTPPTSH